MSDWKFSTLPYTRPDFEAAKARLRASAEEIRGVAGYDDVRRAMLAWDVMDREIATQTTIVHIRHTLDTTDSFYEKEEEALNNAQLELTPLLLEFHRAIVESPFRGAVEAEFGRQYFNQLEIQRKRFCPENVPLMRRENQLKNEYQKLMAGAAIPFGGRVYNLYGIRKFFGDGDRAVRAAAYRAYARFYEENEERLEQIWDELITIRNQMGRNLGYENFVPLGYIQQRRTDYGQEEVAAFREQVRAVLVPLCQQLYEAQARRLGVERLMVYDETRLFPDGNAVPVGDEAALVEAARTMYHDLSPETGEFIDYMIDHRLMDLENRPGKAAAGYMTNLPSLKAPFVFSCFNGTTGDVQVLTHEMGHAFAGYLAMRTQPLRDFFAKSTDISEIHSMSMEQFSYPYAHLFFGDQADKFRFSHLQEALTFVPFGVAIDEFQHICYSRPELTPRERTWEWHKLEEKYMPWRRYEDDPFLERGGHWYHKLHIFLYPFYYINYTLTTMGALEFKRKMAEDPRRAWADYLRLCRLGGSKSYLETLKDAGLASPFAEGAVERAVAWPREILLSELERWS